MMLIICTVNNSYLNTINRLILLKDTWCFLWCRNRICSIIEINLGLKGLKNNHSIFFVDRYIPSWRIIVNVMYVSQNFVPSIWCSLTTTFLFLSVCQEWRITLSITHKTLNILTTEDASHQPIEGCTALIKCRLELNCHRRYSIMHTDFTSSYYAKRCFEILMCLRLVQPLM